MVAALIGAIEERGVEEEGLYRVAGQYSQIVFFKDKLWTESIKAFTARLDKQDTVHVHTSLLKTALREMRPVANSPHVITRKRN